MLESALVTDGHHDLLAVLQLLQEPLVCLRGLRVQAVDPSQFDHHDLAQRPGREVMVLIDMRDSQRLRRQDDLGVVVEVELE